MELRQCRNGHDMRLVDVHLRSVNGVTAYRPVHGAGAGIQLLKTYECGLCGQVDEVKEEIE